MGRGIVWLLAQHMLHSSLQDNSSRHLFAIDLSMDGLQKMEQYIEGLALKYAERNIVGVRKRYKDHGHLIDNEDFILAYVRDISSLIHTSHTVASAYTSELIFEAVAEKIDIKTSLFQDIDKNSVVQPFFFTNTSSIPISEIEKEAQIEGRLIGLHFYNPPPVQKLLEIIPTSATSTELKQLANNIATELKKTIIYAPDQAGFIGNGQFLREVSYAVSLAQELSKDCSLPEALYQINEVTKHLLLRPMGIFELMDYVGINVCSSIMDIMKKAFPEESFNEEPLTNWLNAGALGGQDNKGKTQDGIFKYEAGQITAAFDGATYQNLQKINFGKLAPYSWKELKPKRNIDPLLLDYFNTLKDADDALAKMAIQYGLACTRIGEHLVSEKIALSKEDVNQVMTLGFHQIYGPINNFLTPS